MAKSSHLIDLGRAKPVITFSERRDIDINQIVPVYKANNWSSANKPKVLYQALLNSHYLVSAWDNDKLVGISNAISDGFLVVYYSHLLIHPDYQGLGIGKKLVEMLQKKYAGFHMQILVADGKAIAFYEKCGFIKAAGTQSMWIYQGDEYYKI